MKPGSKKDLDEYQEILQHNKHYQQAMLEKDKNYFKNLSTGQHPEYLLIGCSDSRVPSDVLIEEDAGEVFVHRNIANQVLPIDGNVNAVIQYACDHLKVKHIIVLGHTQCGGIQAALNKVCLGGQLDLWLGSIRGTVQKHQDFLNTFDDTQKLYQLTKLNVVDQVHNIWKNPFVQARWQEGTGIWVHGWIFHVETGLIEDTILENHMPQAIMEAFLLNSTSESSKVVEQPKGMFSCFDGCFAKKKAKK